jgi:hypothetical protein
MINTNKVLEQIYKLILAYTKDKKLDSNSAKYVLKTAVEKVLEFNNLNIEAAEAIVSVIEKSKVLEKITSLDFNRLSDNKDYIDPLYGKPINIKQVLSIVHGVIDSQIKSLDDVLFEAQDEEVKSEINEIKLSPITRFSPNAYRLLSKKTVLFESEGLEDIEEDEEESKLKPYKKLLEIANIIGEDNSLEQIKEIITEFKEPSVYRKKTVNYESKKEDFVSKVFSKKRGKIVEAIFLKNLEESGLFNVEVEGEGNYADNVLPGLMKEGKSSFNLYSLYNKIINNSSFEPSEATINKVKTSVNFNDFIEDIEVFKNYDSLCKANIKTFLDKTKEYFKSISGKITFGAFKTKFKFGEEDIQDFYYIENESVKEKIDKNEKIKSISIINNCFIPKFKLSIFDFYLDLKITLQDDTEVKLERCLCVDVKNLSRDYILATSSQMTSLSNFPFVTIVNIKEDAFQVKTFLTKSLNRENSTYFRNVKTDTFNSQEAFSTSFNDINSFVKVNNNAESPRVKSTIFEAVKRLRLELKTFNKIKDLLNKEFNIKMSSDYYRSIWRDYAKQSDLKEYKEKIDYRIQYIISSKLELKADAQIKRELEDKKLGTISVQTVKNYWVNNSTPEQKLEYEQKINEHEQKIKNRIEHTIKRKLELAKDAQIKRELEDKKLGTISVQTIKRYWINNSTPDQKSEYELLKIVKNFKNKKLSDENIAIKTNKTIEEKSKNKKHEALKDKEGKPITVDANKVNDLLVKLRDIQ